MSNPTIQSTDPTIDNANKEGFRGNILRADVVDKNDFWVVFSGKDAQGNSVVYAGYWPEWAYEVALSALLNDMEIRLFSDGKPTEKKSILSVGVLAAGL